MTRMQQRGATAAQWADPSYTFATGTHVLLAREIGVETDTLKWKIGDGSTTWNSLAYQPNTATTVTLWKANTAYLAGQPVLSPTGFVVTALANFTSSSSYVAGNWSTPSGGGITVTDLGNGLASLTASGGSSVTDLGNGLAAVA